MTKEDITKAAAQDMLKRGLASYLEIAELSGRSRQIVRHWGQQYLDSRTMFLRDQWERAVKRATKRAAGH